MMMNVNRDEVMMEIVDVYFFEIVIFCFFLFDRILILYFKVFFFLQQRENLDK